MSDRLSNLGLGPNSELKLRPSQASRKIFNDVASELKYLKRQNTTDTTDTADTIVDSPKKMSIGKSEITSSTSEYPWNLYRKQGLEKKQFIDLQDNHIVFTEMQKYNAERFIDDIIKIFKLETYLDDLTLEDKISTILCKMADKNFYKKLEEKYRADINLLYQDGTHPADIREKLLGKMPMQPTDITIAQTGFGVPSSSDIDTKEEIDKIEGTQTVSEAGSSEDKRPRECPLRLDRDAIDNALQILKEFHGESIAHIVRNIKHNQELDALTDLTVYYLTQSKKKAFLIDNYKELHSLWHKVRDTYYYQTQFDTKEGVELIRYTQRYSHLRKLQSDKKTLQALSRRTTTRIYTFLSYSFRPSHKTAFLKQQMTKTFGQELPRRYHIEMKHPKKRAIEDIEEFQNTELTANQSEEMLQRPKLKGKWHNEQRRLNAIIYARKQYEDELKSIELKELQGTLPFEKIVHDTTEFLNACAYQNAFHTEEGYRLIGAVRQVQADYKAITQNHTSHMTNSNVEKGTQTNKENLDELKKDLTTTIKKYGCSPWKSLLNDISSDAGAVFTVVTTSLALGGCAS